MNIDRTEHFTIYLDRDELTFLYNLLDALHNEMPDKADNDRIAEWKNIVLDAIKVRK